MRDFIQDLRYAIRTMAKRPGFTIVAALTLALGIGANTAIFSAVNAVLLKPFPFPESEQLVDLAETFKPNNFGSVSVPNFEDWKNQNTVFTGISAYTFAGFNLEGGDTPQRIQGMNVSANFFDVLGVKPTLGRAFLAGEDVAGNERVVILSDELWRSRFAANLNIVNQTIPLNGHTYTIVGVMPRELSSLHRGVQMWSPLVFSEKEPRGSRRTQVSSDWTYQVRRHTRASKRADGRHCGTSRAAISEWTRRSAQANRGALGCECEIGSPDDDGCCWLRSPDRVH